MFHLLRRSPSSNMMHLRMLSVTAGVLMLSLVSGSRCPDQLHCGDEQECCQSFGMIDAADADILYNTVCPDDSFCPWKFSCLRVSETYGCCPLAQGVACSDGKHCCPSDRECTADGTSCVRKTGADVPCDGTEACPDGSTCCKDGLGGWGCCPSPQAVCCEDFIHCCPEGTMCNRANQSCDDASGSVAWLKKVPNRPINGQKAPETNLSNVPCDDTVACPDGTTCCKDGKGGWGCCPFTQAVCCEDFIHCCPQGKTCNLAAQTCDDPSGSVPWLKKVLSRPIEGQSVPETKLSNVPCDDTVACPDGTTCCKDGKGGWGCCPFTQAVCCEDFIHCCPQGKTCNLAAQTCDDPSGSVPWLKKVPSRPRVLEESLKTKASNVPCDDTVACPDGTTCCKDGKGGWGCCPFIQAVCCEDFIHCCPQGKTCNLAAQTCDDLSGSVPWLKKVPSRPIEGQSVPETKLSNVPCDDTVACPDGTTCCKDGKGGWGCCPFTQAVCCEDFIHCCPQGKTCNLAAQTCDDPSGSVPWLTKVPSRPIEGQSVPETKLSNVPCDDTVACPDGTTCCKDGKGGWGCCPFTQAVCCEDFIHCCPQGKKCNLAAQTCDDPSGSVPWLTKVPSRPINGQKVLNTNVSDVPCDDTVACPDGTTCCKDGKGGWGCCPFTQGVCCEDFIHCCPHGKKCNLAAMTCDDPSGSVPWRKKEPTRPIRKKNNPEESLVPCNQSVACPDGNTCCKNTQGGWSCCPFPQAVCCEDLMHCCPTGKKCNLATLSCDGPSESVPWMKKEAARPTAPPTQNASDGVMCDPQTQCPDHTTCCLMKKSQKWGCCPLDQATCCEDGENCCPKGYTCRDQWCVKNARMKFESSGDTPSPQVQANRVCGEAFQCKNTETCCRISEKSWGCCPFPKAVCCSDTQSCCPAGYTCDKFGSCTPAMGFNWDVFFSKKKRAV